MDCTRKETFFIALFLTMMYLGNSQFSDDPFTAAVECIAETKAPLLCKHLVRCGNFLSEEDKDALNQCVEDQLPEVFPNGVTECPQQEVDSSEAKSSNIVDCVEKKSTGLGFDDWEECILRSRQDCRFYKKLLSNNDQ
ncbi:hypothetical protein TNIN_142961 [Trichonephila inaurata madagascariensis]|uniref:Uncharacterized protein n=1 Tax=Trichonephila inaurata madagascariensis TaxID=2747483 RepID=A0A8X6YYR2_9ARAC|nr:hypothetical protein TNIN_142961 [Trichonephila inaurata madagascariensis]